jgi:hypothetical protein
LTGTIEKLLLFIRPIDLNNPQANFVAAWSEIALIHAQHCDRIGAV